MGRRVSRVGDTALGKFATLPREAELHGLRVEPQSRQFFQAVSGTLAKLVLCLGAMGAKCALCTLAISAA